MTEIGKIMLLFVIVDSEKNDAVIGLLKKMNCTGIMSIHGKGTARSEMLTTLGIGESDKFVIMCAINAENEEKVLARLSRRLQLDNPGSGIAFTVDINSVGGLKALTYLRGLHASGGI